MISAHETANEIVRCSLTTDVIVRSVWCSPSVVCPTMAVPAGTATDTLVIEPGPVKRKLTGGVQERCSDRTSPAYVTRTHSFAISSRPDDRRLTGLPREP